MPEDRYDITLHTKKISFIILNIRNFYFRLTLSINNGICAISSGHEPQTILTFSTNSSLNRIEKFYKAEKINQMTK